MRKMTPLAVALAALALAVPTGASAQPPLQQGCSADMAQFLQAMQLYIGTLQIQVPGQVPDPQSAALSLVRSDALALDWCSA